MGRTRKEMAVAKVEAAIEEAAEVMSVETALTLAEGMLTTIRLGGTFSIARYIRAQNKIRAALDAKAIDPLVASI